MPADALPLEPEVYRRWQRGALVAGGAGLVLVAVGWLIDRPSAVRSYLWAYNFWLSIALGSLVLAMLHFLTGGVWGLILRRINEAAMRTLPLLAILFIPLAVNIGDVYLWANPDAVAADEALQRKTWYLTPTLFWIRAAIYFGIWIVLAEFVYRWSADLDQPDAPPNPRHLRKLSAAGLVLYAGTITTASVDWIMSLEPHWYSTIFAPLFGVSQVLSGLAFGILVLVLLIHRPPLATTVGRPHLRDLGSLLLAFVMVWAYLGFSQFLLIWCGNLPTENPYYLRRLQGGWQYIAVLIVAAGFFLPFLLLLSGDIKRTASKLLYVAGVVLAMRLVDLFWMVVPARAAVTEQESIGILSAASWLDVVAPIGIGGIWLAAFLALLQRRPLLPVYDPLLAEARHHE